MRLFRISTIALFIASLLFSLGANIYYYRNTNRDHPVLTNSVELLELSIHDEASKLMEGLSAVDATDGDLTDKIMVAATSHFLEPGTLNVKYVVFDSHNNSATLTRKVRYSDYESPKFTLSKAPVYVKGDSFDLLNYIQVNDALDGDISDRIRVITNAVSNYSAGTYPVTLSVSNSCGDTAQLELWVTYLDKKNTADIILHKYLLYLEQGQLFDPHQWIASVTAGDHTPLSRELVTVQGNLDTQTPGYYQLTYSYSDANYSGQTSLTVVVTEKEG